MPAITGRLLLVGDSILTHNAVSDPWSDQVQAAYANTQIAATSGVGLIHQAPNSGAAATYAASFSGNPPANVWIELGINDPGSWASAAAFGTAYGDLLDAFAAEYPGVRCFAQTMLAVNSEPGTPETTLDAYRQAIRDAVSTRTSFVTLVDWATLMTGADTSDGVHPSQTAHDNILFPAAMAELFPADAGPHSLMAFWVGGAGVYVQTAGYRSLLAMWGGGASAVGVGGGSSPYYLHYYKRLVNGVMD